MNWKEPKIQIQNFEPNEYVAACYKLVCHRGSEGNNYIPESYYWGSEQRGTAVSHSLIGTPNTCGDADANRVITDDGGTFESVGEYNGEQGWINGKFTHLIDNDNSNSITPGDIIFWYTVSGNNDRQWNHWGVVQQQDPNHPNHS